jgi:hypothetical protein
LLACAYVLGSELRREIPDFVVFTKNFGNLGFRYS